MAISPKLSSCPHADGQGYINRTGHTGIGLLNTKEYNQPPQANRPELLAVNYSEASNNPNQHQTLKRDSEYRTSD